MALMNFLRWLFAFSLLVLIACSDSVKRLASAKGVVRQEMRAENFSVSLMSYADSAVSGKLLSFPSVNLFYRANDFMPVWTNRNLFNQRGDSLIRIIRTAPYHGFVAEDYHLAEIDSILLAAMVSSDPAELLATLDILLTDAFIGIGYHIRHGRLHKDNLNRHDKLPEIDSALIDVLTRSVFENRITQTLESLEPPKTSYKAFRLQLKNKIDSLSVADDSVSNALQIQIRQLAANMEQLRWEAYDSSQRYILVNIPSFRLGIFDRDSLVFESNVVVGSTETPTPTLDAVIKSFVLFPAWNVPRKIAVQELLPKIKRDTSYLASHNYHVYDNSGNFIHPDSVDWKRYGKNNFPFLIKQGEGDNNALGIIKFVFINEHDIYLHDTNAKRSFQNDFRALSHGCVRVEKAIDMAKFLVQENNPWCSPQDLQMMLAGRQQRQVSLNPIDLRIRYYTCEAQTDGTVRFYPDVYGLNNKLIEAMYCRNN